MSAVPTFPFPSITTGAIVLDAPAPRRGWRFASIYRWFALLAVLDVLLTSIILTLGGTESNALACLAFRTLGVWGLILLKLGCASVLIAVCERVGRERPALARQLARAAVAANCVPVAFGVVCMGIFAMHLVPAML